MKKLLTAICLILFSIASTSVCGCTAIGCSVLSRSIVYYELSEQHAELEGGYTSVKIRDIAGSVKVERGEDWSLSYFDGEKRKYTIGEGQELNIECRESYAALEQSRQNPVLTLAVPQSFTGSINIYCNAGILSLERLKFEDVIIDTNVAEINMSGITASSLDITSGIGSILCSDITSAQFSCKAATGSIKIENLDAAKVYLETDVGSIDASLSGTLEDYTVTVKGSSNIADRTGGSRTLSAISTLGSINISFV